MSAENFIKLFKEKRKTLEGSQEFNEYATWVTNKKSKTWFSNNRDELEALGLSKTVGLIVSSDKADQLGVGPAFQELIKTFSSNKDISKPIVEIIDGKPTVLFSDVAFKGGIERTLDKYLGTGTYKEAKNQKLIKGHVYGFMTGAILGARDSAYKFLTASHEEGVPILGKEEADHALHFLDVLIDHLSALDRASAEIKTITAPVLLKYVKSSTEFLVELQAEDANAESAKLVQTLSGKTGGATGIRGLMNPRQIQKDALEGILNNLRKDGSFSARELLDFESSPSLKTLLVDDIISVVTGKPKKLNKLYSANNIKLPTKITIASVNEDAKRKYQEDLRKVKKEAVSNRAKIKNKLSTQKYDVKPTNVNLSSLLIYINSHLQSVISANMGDGNDKKVLNYRSGRFASSAKVERLSESRQGMISAFYSYMKNPYQTFEPGYAQGEPASRSPKLLISKSIREIAATKVANQLRAISV